MIALLLGMCTHSSILIFQPLLSFQHALHGQSSLWVVMVPIRTQLRGLHGVSSD